MYSLSHLVTDAATGGTGGNAFDVNGYLIPGALPYWNIWSWGIPAEWDYTNGPMELRLPRNAAATLGYDYRLGGFRQYDHTAAAPQVAVSSTVTFTSGAGSIGVLMNIHQWHLPADVTHILVKIVIAAAAQTILIDRTAVDWTAELIEGYTSSFTGVSATSVTVTIYASNASAQELANITPWMSGAASISFTISHSSTVGTLSRLVAYSFDENLTLNAAIYPGTGNISIAAGTTALSGIAIRVTAASATVSNFSFDLYLLMTGETDLFVGSFNGMATSEGYVNDYYLDEITLSSAVAGGDNLGFIMTNLSY
jgi:hypothetical protein